MVKAAQQPALNNELTHALASFRYQLRLFLQFSENAAHAAGLHPQQHQLLLQIAGAPEGCSTTIAWAAERLGLRHNSTVELVDRLVKEQLLLRSADPADGRRVVLRMTPRGERMLGQLSAYHACELYDLAPELLRSIRGIGRHERGKRIERKRAHP